MSNENIERRHALASELLIKLKNVIGHIKTISADIEDSSHSFLSKVYEDYNEKIVDKVNQYNQNVEEVKSLNLRITGAINEWYQFTKNKQELVSLLFPMKFFIRRKGVIKNVNEFKQEITGLAIKNRILHEEIVHLESTLEYEATKRLKGDVRYEDYLTHVKTKTLLIDELRYIIPTLADVSICELNTDNLNELIEKLPHQV